MRKYILALSMTVIGHSLFAQNLELWANKNMKQPAKVNPAMAGLQESFFRLLTETDLNNYNLMLEGKLPMKLGNYMLGFERLANEYVGDNMFNITYAKSYKKNDDFLWRLGGSMEVHSRTLMSQDTGKALYRYTDLNGNVTEWHSLDQMVGEINYFNLDIGASLTYKKLLASLSVNNALSPNVSLIEGTERRLPLTAQFLLGGFVGLGKKATLFPYANVSIFNNEYFTELNMVLKTQYINIGGSYINDSGEHGFSANLASRYKSSFFGINYTQSLSETNPVGEFRVFVNSSIFKNIGINKSSFAKEMSFFY